MNDRLQKLSWRARRGMLELDTLFQEYFNRYGDQLNASQMDIIEELLFMQDQDLFDTFCGKRDLDDARMDALFKEMIEKVNALKVGQ